MGDNVKRFMIIITIYQCYKTFNTRSLQIVCIIVRKLMFNIKRKLH